MKDSVQKRILCLFKEAGEAEPYVKFLSLKKYFVYTYSNIIEAMGQIYNDPPDFILLSEGMPGWNQFLKDIKQDLVYCHLPLILILSKSLKRDIISLSMLPFDDWVFIHEDIERLFLRIKMKEHHASSYLDANPLTRLPGNVSIKRTIQNRIESKKDFGLGYIDIDNFKSFNDKYGFARGDDMIRMTARIMVNVIHRLCVKEGFAGHVGGDDYVFVVPSENLEEVCKQIIQNFNLVSSTVSDDVDRIRGYIVCEDRQGVKRKFPLPSLSIAAIDSRITRMAHSEEASNIAGELKKLVKKKNGSNYFINRRIKAKK